MSSKTTSKSKIFLIFLVALALGGAIVYLYVQTGATLVSVPSDQSAIVKSFQIKDTVYGDYLTSTCVGSGSSPMLAIVPLSTTTYPFTAGQAYHWTSWIWYSYSSQGYSGKDPNAAMEFWGPNTQGQYVGMISPLASNPLELIVNGVPVGNITMTHTLGFAVDANGVFHVTF